MRKQMPQTAGAFTLEYWVDRDAVTIIWGWTRQIVPLTGIERIVLGVDATLAKPAGWWHWPCPERSRRHHQRLGVVNAYSTRGLVEQIVLVTPNECFGVSPRDTDGFMEAVQTRFALGTARPLRSVLIRPPLWTWPLWRDRTALLLIGVGLLVLIAMFGILSVRFPSLSSDLPLHFNVHGVPDRISPKSSLFALPIIGLVTWLLNLVAGVWIYRRIQRGGAYLLWGGAVVVQLIAGIALINLTRW